MLRRGAAEIATAVNISKANEKQWAEVKTENNLPIEEEEDRKFRESRKFDCAACQRIDVLRPTNPQSRIISIFHPTSHNSFMPVFTVVKIRRKLIRQTYIYRTCSSCSTLSISVL